MNLQLITLDDPKLMELINRAVEEALEKRSISKGEGLLTTAEVAKAIRRNKCTVLRYLKAGKVKDYSTNGYPLFKLSEFIKIDDDKYAKM
jgi:hypothetical protein